MDNVPIHPPPIHPPPIHLPWWPVLLSDLLFLPRPFPGPGPMNNPQAVEDIMASLGIHTMSYMWLDQQAAQQLRNMVEQELVKTVQNLSRLHDEAVARNQSGLEQKS